MGFQFVDMSKQLFLVRPTDEVVADHLVRPQGRFAARPEADQQTSDNGAVRLDFNPFRIGAQQMAAPQNMLEEAEEDFDRPPLLVDDGDHLRGHIQQVGGNPQVAVALVAGRATTVIAPLDMRRRFHHH